MNARFLVITGMVLAAAAARLLPHPPNFAPIAAMALFGGAYLSRKWLAFLVPLSAMVLSDVLLYHLHTQRYLLSEYLTRQLFIYACFAVMVGAGFSLRNRRTALPILGVTIGCSIFFFLMTNLWVWLTQGGFGRELTPAGLLLCYQDAIPFFHNTLLGDLFFVGALFGGFALLEQWLPSLRESSAPAAAPVEQEAYATADR